MAGGIKGQPRLNRKRYAVAVKALQEIIGSKQTSADRRIKCVELLLEVYRRHDRSVYQKQVQDRYVERKAEAARLEAELQTRQQEAQSKGETVEESVDEFLKRIQAKAEVSALAGLLNETGAEPAETEGNEDE